MGGDLNCNVPRSFAVVMILKRGLQSVKLPLFYVKLKKKGQLYLLEITHTKIGNVKLMCKIVPSAFDTQVVLGYIVRQ